MILVGYTVMRQEEPETSEPYCICRIRVFKSVAEDRQQVDVVAQHASRNLARYWATMLNEGRYTEEQVCEAIKSGGLIK